MGSPSAGHLLYAFVLGQRRFLFADSPQVQLALRVMVGKSRTSTIARVGGEYLVRHGGCSLVAESQALDALSAELRGQPRHQ